jgi:hypothetical protein
MNKIPFFLFLVLLSITSCGKKQSTQITSDTFETLDPEFKSFYSKFLSDSTYQMSHIVFPLEGKAADSIGNKTSWEAITWDLHQPYKDVAGEFTRTFEKLGDMMTLELIRHNELPYIIERRFAKLLGEEWYLVYYRVHNQIDQPETQIIQE